MPAETAIELPSMTSRTMRETAALVPLLCGLFLAPWLTMVCRSPIGGAVFTVAIPGTLIVVGELIGTSLYGPGIVMEAFRLTFVWLGALALSFAGVVMGWWTLMRLEVIDGPAEHVNFARLFRGAASARFRTPMTRRSPIVLPCRRRRTARSNCQTPPSTGRFHSWR